MVTALIMTPLLTAKKYFNDDTLTDAAQHIYIQPHLRQVGLMWQDGQLFPHLSVRENLLYGYKLQTEEKRRFSPESVIELLEIGNLLNQQPRHLSGGERQRVALGRTLLAMPRLLLLDEPSMGLAPIIVQRIFEIVRNINQDGTAILLVEQNARLALSIADRAYVMDGGKITLTGSGKELLNNPEVRHAYLGE